MGSISRYGGAGLAFSALLGTVAFAPAGGAPPSHDGLARATAVPDGSRIAAARLYQGGSFTARGHTPASVGQVLARLHPTFVMAPVRYGAGDRVRAAEVDGWRTVRNAVVASNPKAEFGVALNALQYPRARPLHRMMTLVRRRMNPDAWIFDFFAKAAKRRMRVMRKAVASAHRHGESVGGIVFRIAEPPRIPVHTDFVVAQGGDSGINGPGLEALAKRFEVFVQIGNNPRNPRSDGCRFINDFGSRKRAALIRRRARQQAAHDFRFAYPVFFPTCRARRVTPAQQGGVAAYDASADGRMMRRIRRLMDRHE